MKTLKFEEREKAGKSHAKQLRREGKIPAVIYGHGENPQKIYIEKSDLKSYTHEHKEEIIRLGGGRGKNVVIKEVQYNPVTGEAMHIDFMHIHKGEKLKVSIPIILEGTAHGVKEGGVMEQWIREIEIECLPKDIPNEFTLDIAGLGVGESLHIRDLSVGDEIKLHVNPDDTVVSVMAPRKEEVKPVVEEEEIVEEIEEEAVGEAEEKEPEKEE